MKQHIGLKEFAYREIKTMLLTGRIKPGDRIREDHLAQELSVSRTPVREAVNRLASEGFIQELPRRGLFAARFTKKQLYDIATVHENLSLLAIQQCVAALDEKKKEKLAEVFDCYKDACMRGDSASTAKYDTLFHVTIAELTGNRTLYEYICELEDMITYARFSDNYTYGEGGFYQFHQNVFDAIMNEDAVAAAKLVNANTHSFLEWTKLPEDERESDDAGAEA